MFVSASRPVQFTSVHDGFESASKATAAASTARRGDSVGKQETLQKGGDTDVLPGIVHAGKINKDRIDDDGSLVNQSVVVVVFSSTHTAQHSSLMLTNCSVLLWKDSFKCLPLVRISCMWEFGTNWPL